MLRGSGKRARPPLPGAERKLPEEGTAAADSPGRQEEMVWLTGQQVQMLPGGKMSELKEITLKS